MLNEWLLKLLRNRKYSMSDVGVSGVVNGCGFGFKAEPIISTIPTHHHDTPPPSLILVLDSKSNGAAYIFSFIVFWTGLAPVDMTSYGEAHLTRRELLLGWFFIISGWSFFCFLHPFLRCWFCSASSLCVPAWGQRVSSEKTKISHPLDAGSFIYSA